jgi:hypothetical protein
LLFSLFFLAFIGLDLERKFGLGGWQALATHFTVKCDILRDVRCDQAKRYGPTDTGTKPTRGDLPNMAPTVCGIIQLHTVAHWRATIGPQADPAARRAI